MTGDSLSSNLSHQNGSGSVSTSEPRTGGSVEAGMANEAVATDPGERITVGQDRTDGRRGLVQISVDGSELVVGVNPNGHPFSWSLAVINREQAAELRDWLDRQLNEFWWNRRRR